jgi:hypothetical protein
MSWSQVRSQSTRSLVVLAAFLLFSHPMHAPTSTAGVLVGRITDPSGAAVTGATVRLVNLSTNLWQDAVTVDNVNFNNPSLPFTGSTVSSFGVLSSTFVPENRQASSRWILYWCKTGV